MKEFRASTITWDPSEDPTYLPGSVITKKGAGISFKNELMSPGKAIVKWFSQVNYQAQKITPKLPLLEVDRSYRLTLQANIPPKKVYLKLVFLNRFGETIATEFIKAQEGIFKVPLETYEYQLELINAGVTEFFFEKLILTHAEDELKGNYLFELNEPNNEEMAVFFGEPSRHGVFRPKKFEASLMIDSLDAYQAFEQDLELKKRLVALNKRVKKLVFVGSGPCSAVVAAYYSVLFERALLVADTAEVDLKKFTGSTNETVTLFALEQKLKTAKNYHRNMKKVDTFAEKLYENNVNYDFLRIK